MAPVHCDISHLLLFHLLLLCTVMVKLLFSFPGGRKNTIFAHCVRGCDNYRCYKTLSNQIIQKKKLRLIFITNSSRNQSNVHHGHLFFYTFKHKKHVHIFFYLYHKAHGSCCPCCCWCSASEASPLTAQEAHMQKESTRNLF